MCSHAHYVFHLFNDSNSVISSRWLLQSASTWLISELWKSPKLVFFNYCQSVSCDASWWVLVSWTVVLHVKPHSNCIPDCPPLTDIQLFSVFSSDRLLLDSGVWYMRRWRRGSRTKSHSSLLIHLSAFHLLIYQTLQSSQNNLIL